jgi:hypothetical protein
MKILLSLSLALILVASVAAQDDGESNKFWIGGKAAFGAMAAQDFTIGPSFGLMLTKVIAAGIVPTFSGGNNTSAWNIEVHGRYYVPVVESFSFYSDAFVGLGGGDIATNVDGGEYNTLDFGVRAGFQYWFAPKWSVAASSNVLLYTSSDGDGEFGAGVDFSAVNFSFFFHF